MQLNDARDIAALDAVGQAEAVRRGDLRVDEPAEAARLRIEQANPALNAVTWLAEAAARPPIVDGPLAGVPWLLKASLEYPGWPFTGCSRSRARARGARIWPFTRACLDAGLVPMGLTGMPEFGLLTTGEALATGPVHNPAAPGRSAGGSSSGAAAAVAAGLVPLAHGSDAAGSIRIPAANCGVIGLKPSRGANLRARAPHLIDDVLCSDMLIARTMRDIEAAFDIVSTAGPDAAPRGLRGLRIGLARHGLDGRAPDPAVAGTLERAARDLQQAGAIVEETALPGDGEAIVAAFKAVWIHEGGEIADLVGAASPGRPLTDLLEPWTLGLAAARGGIRAGETANAFRQLGLSELAAHAFFERYDLLLSPVAPEPPIALGRHAPDRDFAGLWADFWPFVNFTPHANIAGLPAISLPFWGGCEHGPIGIMMTMAAGADRALIALARELEGRMHRV